MPTNPKVTEEMVREIEKALAAIEISTNFCAYADDYFDALDALSDHSVEWLRALLQEREELLGRENRREGWEACREAAAKDCLDAATGEGMGDSEWEIAWNNACRQLAQAIRNLEYPEG